MNSTSIHIAIASTTSKPGEVAKNLQQITTFARQAAGDNADLLLTPEMSASGYGSYPEVLATAEVAGNGPIFECLANSAQQTGVIICAGFVETNNSQTLISHYIVYPDGHFKVQRKHCISPSEAPLSSAAQGLDANTVSAGHAGIRWALFEVRNIRCALVICADFGFADLSEVLEKKGVKVLLLATGSGGKREDRIITKDLYSEAGRAKYCEVLETVFFPGHTLIANCLRHRHALAAVNLCGYDGQKYFHMGHGSITNAMGEVIGFFHGLPNIDRQRPMYAHAVIDVEDCL